MAALPPFADETALGEWLGEDITDEKDVKRAQRCLRAASNRIRRYTKRSWGDEKKKNRAPPPRGSEGGGAPRGVRPGGGAGILVLFAPPGRGKNLGGVFVAPCDFCRFCHTPRT